jgi:mRNA-degrading endonuclease toxin of MazEF toxin-antitoxin module
VGVRSEEIGRWKVVLVHFGNKRRDELSEYPNLSFDPKYEFLLGSEFDYMHMAIIVNNNEMNHSAVVVPMTSLDPYKHSYDGDVVIERNQYGMNFLQNPTIIRTECIRQISHRRIVKIINHHVSTTVREKIKKALEKTILDLTR